MDGNPGAATVGVGTDGESLTDLGVTPSGGRSGAMVGGPPIGVITGVGTENSHTMVQGAARAPS